jgi:hypothetical protein
MSYYDVTLCSFLDSTLHSVTSHKTVIFAVTAIGISVLYHLLFLEVYLFRRNSEENHVEFYWFSKYDQMCLGLVT